MHKEHRWETIANARLVFVQIPLHASGIDDSGRHAERHLGVRRARAQAEHQESARRVTKEVNARQSRTKAAIQQTSRDSIHEHLVAAQFKVTRTVPQPVVTASVGRSVRQPIAARRLDRHQRHAPLVERFQLRCECVPERVADDIPSVKEEHDVSARVRRRPVCARKRRRARRWASLPATLRRPFVPDHILRDALDTIRFRRVWPLRSTRRA